MANGLFMSPEQIIAAQRPQALSRQGMQDVLRGSLFNLGNTATRGLVSAFGGDPRSQAEMQAEKMQGLLKGMNFNDPQSITDAANALNQGGNQAEAFKLLELLPKGKDDKISFQDILNEDTGKVEKWRMRNGDFDALMGIDSIPVKPQDRLIFRDLYNPETEQYETHRYVNGQDQGVEGIAKPGKTTQDPIRSFYNPDKNIFEHWTVKDGKKNSRVGIAKPGADTKSDDIDWQFKGEYESPDNGTVSVRFNPNDDSAAGFQMLVDQGNGPEWVQAPAGMKRPVTRTQEVPPSVEGSARGKAKTSTLIAEDEVLGAWWSGLSITERDTLAERINDEVSRFVLDSKGKHTWAEARDMAIDKARRDAVEKDSFLGIPMGLRLKSSAEMLEQRKRRENQGEFYILGQ